MVEGGQPVKFVLTKQERILGIAIGTALLVISFLCIYPFWYVFVLSINEGTDASKGGIYWWPREFTIGNYYSVLKDSTIINAFTVSVLRTVIGTLGSIFITAMVAFALSRKEIPGRNMFITVFFITMLFSGGLIPYYLQIQNLGIMNSFWVYVLPGLFSIWNMIVMKTSFKSNIPEALFESAKIDGAGYFRIFFQLVFPLSLPMLAALSLFTAVWHWNDWFTGAFFVSDYKLHPLQTYLQRILTTNEASNLLSQQLDKIKEAQAFHSQALTTRSIRMATIMVATLPILFVYPFLQRYFVQGVMIGSIKE